MKAQYNKRFVIDNDWWTINTWCHRCLRDGLLFSRWGRRGKTVEMRCKFCQGKEFRKVHR